MFYELNKLNKLFQKEMKIKDKAGDCGPLNDVSGAFIRTTDTLTLGSNN